MDKRIPPTPNAQAAIDEMLMDVFVVSWACTLGASESSVAMLMKPFLVARSLDRQPQKLNLTSRK
jgi:hypothetical protein